jgi:Lysylphosphatidylglycerol synthase TM region
MTHDTGRHTVRGGPRRRRRPWFEIFLFLVGGGFFALLVSTIGTAPITEALACLGPALGLVVGVELFAILANALSWRSAIDRERRGEVPFVRLVAARIVGDALNYVIPAGAGEISKVRVLSRYIPMESALASVALAKVTEGIALGVFGLLGLAAVWPVVAARPASAVPIVAAALAGAGLAAGSLVAVRFGLIAAVVRLFQRLKSGLVMDSRLDLAPATAEREAASGRQGWTGSVGVSTAWHLAGWLVNVAELWLACRFLGLRPSLGVVFAGEALGALCDAVFFFVPMRIGAAEGGRVFLFALLGLGAAQGLALGVVRRVRELTWTAVGLAIYPWLGTRARTVGHRERRDPEATTVNA